MSGGARVPSGWWLPDQDQQLAKSRMNSGDVVGGGLSQMNKTLSSPQCGPDHADMGTQCLSLSYPRELSRLLTITPGTLQTLPPVILKTESTK